MCIQRLRYAQDKQQALAKQYRREVAQLLINSKEQRAQYRVESLINDDIHIELLEILELYCELLLARVSILNSIQDETDLISNHIDDGINEAVRALVFSTLHASEIKELSQLRDLLTFKFGPDFLKVILEGKVGVPEKLLKKCSPNLPPQELVVLYLKEIARTYDAPYSELSEDEESEESSTKNENIDSDSDDGGNVKNEKEENSEDEKPILAVDNDTEVDENEHHPITVRKPRNNSETVTKDLVIPKDIKKEVKVVHNKKKINAKSEDDELEDLKKRFAALRR